MSLAILPLDLDDHAQVSAFLDLLDHYMQGPSGQGAPMDPALRTSLPQALRQHPNVLSFIAFNAGQPAGLINCVEGFSTFAGKPLLNVHDIVVHSDHRRKGIARALIAHAEGIARQRGCCKLTLEVLEGNTAARRVYLDTGFLPYQLAPAMGQALFMEKKLEIVRSEELLLDGQAALRPASNICED